MARAIWRDQVLAESDTFETVEGNIYFPPESINREFFRASDQHTTCPWKGVASYYDVAVGDEVNAGAAWYYPEPSEAAAQIKDHIAFWKGVRVEA
ncbi:MAG: DUF427 domain-containing protein [Gemmatimonadota bacterium]|nr:MAG: DUF427 domain-containing protein [Gemmatimonadota bacterium]